MQDRGQIESPCMTSHVGQVALDAGRTQDAGWYSTPQEAKAKAKANNNTMHRAGQLALARPINARSWRREHGCSVLRRLDAASVAQLPQR